MKNYNLFSVLGVMLVLGFVFTCISISDSDELDNLTAISDPDDEEDLTPISTLDELENHLLNSDPDEINPDELEKRILNSDPDELEKRILISELDELENEKKDSKPPDNRSSGKAPAKPAALSQIQVSQLRPSRSSAGTVVFTWTTKLEIENAGFNILRSETRNGPFKPINSALIQGAGTTKKKQTYHWKDASAKPNVVYYYQLETISFAGTRQRLTTVRLQGHVSASGKLATRWAMLKTRR